MLHGLTSQERGGPVVWFWEGGRREKKMNQENSNGNAYGYSSRFFGSAKLDRTCYLK